MQFKQIVEHFDLGNNIGNLTVTFEPHVPPSREIPTCSITDVFPTFLNPNKCASRQIWSILWVHSWFFWGILFIIYTQRLFLAGAALGKKDTLVKLAALDEHGLKRVIFDMINDMPADLRECAKFRLEREWCRKTGGEFKETGGKVRMKNHFSAYEVGYKMDCEKECGYGLKERWRCNAGCSFRPIQTLLETASAKRKPAC
ncbi:hypothetical protein NHQ30_010401 [Ciborinia camelliae]|nr:hypothetical protein NHQ30_010401 [Ciborinia camelliae]